MDEDKNIEIIDKMTKVCICKSISRATMKKVIQNGATTLSEVQKATGAGSGSCHGRRCSVKINALLEELKESDISNKETP
ncbi:MAG: NAD(P)H-nitrite reductase [Anaerocolumna sp.]|jgi:bacterioferritin-associated ferredoxin|nr:NAD(P)H-nitrite reductase [Anaerocolumna sp.]